MPFTKVYLTAFKNDIIGGDDIFSLYVRSPGKITAIFLDRKSIIYGN